MKELEQLKENSLEEVVYRFRFQIALFLLGASLIGVGFWFLRPQSREEPIEVVQEEKEAGGIVVEIQGEVENPGVYELVAGSRVEDLILAAGGIAEGADQDWVRKNLNRAAKISDGAKIYIPKQGESNQAGITSTSSVVGSSSGLVNINTASEAELDKLWGIGPVTARKIIEGRPYSAVEELVTRKILKQNVYETNKDKLSVY